MTPADVLRKAAALIESEGWYHGRGSVPDGDDRAVCPLLAFGDLASRYRVDREVVDSAHCALIDVVEDVARWNDAQPDATVVVAKLREVADDLERAS